MSAPQQSDGDPARTIGTPRAVITDGRASQLPDTDPDETQEWIESLDAVVDHAGRNRARYLMLRMLERSREQQVGVPALRSTDYINTISPEQEPWFPGDLEAERKIRHAIRWNAAIMVHRAQRPGIGVGGHISSYASSAMLYEVGFNHFFRGKDHPGGGDQIYFQGHASPGIYARAFLEGRLTEHQLDGFRQEVSHPGGGLSSYPHPRLMPDFWEFPTVSMGLGPMNAIYQARFNRYLHNRGIADTADQHVWAFLGDGETDEPESLGPIGLAAREELDNLTFVINCNLQRLDGPVRGNGKVIQELESFFRGAGWNVIKVIWGHGWDKLLAADRDGALVNLMNSTPDGDYQTYKAEDGAFVREHFFGRDPRTRKLVEGMSDQEVWDLARGGHDYRKVYAAYKAAMDHKGQPTVILAKTIKGWTLGSHFEGRNSTHQMKKLTAEDIVGFRDRLEIPIPDEQLDKTLPPYYKPDPDSPEMQYMLERRRQLGGAVPRRRSEHKPLKAPEDKAFDVLKRGSGKQEVATTMAFVRLLKELMKDKELAPRFVPIIPDEARTFGMDSLFPSIKIYNPHGQNYTSVDRELMLAYKESEQGQILHEGINEAGSTASFIAAGSSYATHGEAMIPIYIFYSMFGFQRTADSIWAAADQMTRGFLLGATAGRTTLNGEGLQHEDGHSLLLAATNPAVVTYDPAFSFEVGAITRDALARMYGNDPGAPLGGHRDPNVMYYLTIYNEPYRQPAEPEDLDVASLLAGMYRYAEGPDVKGPKAQVLASGVAVPWALRAQELLANDWGVSADVWSVTSWTELRREALEADEWNLLHPAEEPKVPFVTQKLSGVEGPIVAVSDWMKAVPDLIAPFVPGGMASLGTDGFGLSDTRPALRRHFHVDAEAIVVRTLASLAQRGEIDRDVVRQALEKYQERDEQAAPAEERTDDHPAT
ncbi:pyruvate dehydrogenase (acetyl-transferring), homodimeric type [uncultured Modestobacter sp.]|uniref:pyruvate dehydrogenase (acetyl-transferring), homodimeric type n=1 Tax=uncultured Modestobacter sp. TaxID=380048 RepID=UPI00261A3AC9|nr:pyruvate dehydrogenase (acetyl-transferring), homodimeric type [uncultured Modestobacter sp.]